MRILCSNPDTIGDMVLRQPMYRALRQAGHELALIVRPSVAPIVPFVAPGAEALLLPREVYSDELESSWSEFAGLFQAARDFRPDALLVAPFRWTRFEERLADELAELGTRRIGMSGQLYAGDPSAGRSSPSRLAFDVVARVAESDPETSKNAALAAAALGTTVDALGPMVPALEPDAAALESARRTLIRLGLESGQYWIACVGGAVNVRIKCWAPTNWAEALSRWGRQWSRRFLFVGLPAERAAVEAVLAAMDPAEAERSRQWLEADGTLAELVGLTALSCGYAGHDTGPMHIAAALGKPVLAVFGGGTWPRFVPAGAAPAVVATTAVPCVGCGWSCPFHTSHCIASVAVESVHRAADDLESGRIAGLELRPIPADRPLLEQMVRESADFARNQQRDAGESMRQLREMDRLSLRPMLAELEQRRAESAAHRLEAAATQAREAEQRAAIEAGRIEAAALTLRLEAAGAQAQRDRAALLDLAGEAQALRRGLAAREAEAGRLRERARELELRSAPPAPGAGSALGRLLAAARTPRGQALAELIAGSRHYTPRKPPRPLPSIALVLPTFADVRAEPAIESALGQDYPLLELIVAPVADTPTPAPPDDAAPQAAPVGARPGAPVAAQSDAPSPPPDAPFAQPDAPFAPPVTSPAQPESLLADADGRLRFAEPAASVVEAVWRVATASSADLIGWLAPGDSLEPGALRNVGEYFRDHPGVQAAAFEETAESAGRRRPLPGRALDVYSLLAGGPEPSSGSGVFYRRRAYRSLGRFDSKSPRAAGWGLVLRFARRYRIAAAPGHVVCRCESADPLAPPSAPGAGDADRRQKAFLDDADAERRRFEATFGWPGRARCRTIQLAGLIRSALSRPSARLGRRGADRPDRSSDAPAETTADAGLMTRPSRLLLTRPAPGGGTVRIYADPSACVAWGVGDANGVAPPARAADAPAGAAADDGPMIADLLIEALSGDARADDRQFRLLHVDCGDGALLDQFRARVQWELAGTEPGASAIGAAGGAAIWRVEAESAATLIPVGRSFHAIVLDTRAGRALELVRLLRRLRQLLEPGGAIALVGYNLDSKLRELAGADWSGWPIAGGGPLFGRGGIERLGPLVGLAPDGYCTRTAPSAIVRDLRLTEARAGRLAGRARAFWDGRGRGDVSVALLRN